MLGIIIWTYLPSSFFIPDTKKAPDQKDPKIVKKKYNTFLPNHMCGGGGDEKSIKWWWLCFFRDSFDKDDIQTLKLLDALFDDIFFNEICFNLIIQKPRQNDNNIFCLYLRYL